MCSSDLLVTAGTAVNGKVMYSLEYDGAYSTAIPRETDAGEYEVWYKVVSTDGTTETDPCDEPVYVTIAPKEVTPIIRLENQSISAKALVFARLSLLRFSVSRSMFEALLASFSFTSSSLFLLAESLLFWLTTVCRIKIAAIVRTSAVSI